MTTHDATGQDHPVRGRNPRLTIFVIGCVIATCHASDRPDPLDETGTHGASEQDVPPPLFLDPAGGRLTVPSTRTEDLPLGVASVTPGATHLWIDGIDAGTLQGTSPTGTLSAELLTLAFRGALVPALHTLMLQTLGSDSPRASDPVTLAIEPGAVVRLQVTVDRQPFASGTAMAACGLEHEEALVILDHRATPPVVQIAVARGATWSETQLRSTHTPGLLAPSPGTRPAIHASFFPADRRDTDRLRMVWTVGHGERIDGIDAAWDTITSKTPPVAIFSTDSWHEGGLEWVGLGRPWLLGSIVVAEVFASPDVEHPLPGDRSLVARQFDSATRGPIREPNAWGPRDTDRLGPVLDFSGFKATGTRSLNVRIGGSAVGVLDLDVRSQSLRARRDAGTFAYPSLRDANDIATVVGALGSRTVFAWNRKARSLIVLQWSDRLADSMRATAVSGLEQVPQTAGAPTIGLIGGAAVWIVPAGSDAPALAVVTGAATPAVQALEGLRCDDIAVRATRRRSEPVGIACRRGTDVFVGTLMGAPPRE